MTSPDYHNMLSEVSGLDIVTLDTKLQVEQLFMRISFIDAIVVLLVTVVIVM